METSEALRRDLWQQAEREVRQLIEELQTLSEGDLKGLEAMVLKRALALGRQWMTQVLSSPGPQEATVREREGACGHQQHLLGSRPKQVLTLLGKVTFHRPYYHCLFASPQEREAASCSHAEAPADGLWGLQGRRTTAGVQQAVGYLAAQMPLEAAAEALGRLVPVEMSARQVLNLIQPLGEQVLPQQEEQVQALWQQALQAGSEATACDSEPVKDIERLYIETDGILTRLRRGSVLLEDEEKQRTGDVYREIKVAAIFEAQPGPHRSTLAPGVFVDQAGPKSYLARRAKAEDFGKLLYCHAVQCGLRRAQQVVVVGDGAPWIWNLAAEHFPEAVQIVDGWHAQEQVWEVASAVFGRTTPQGVAWAKQACSWLIEGQIEMLVKAIEALPPVAPPPGASRTVPQVAVDYFTTNAQRMRYPLFRAQGMHLGSGIAEAACKSVVSTRAKRTGMRWTPKGLEALLALRTCVLNQSYDAFCQQQPRLLA